jgi:DNA modification methylase
VAVSVYAGRKAGQSIIEGRTVNTLDDWVMSIPPKNLSAFLLDDGAWKKVRSVTDAGEAEVWDIQVDEDESFIAEGCAVHNCPLQLDVIQRAIDLWTNRGDTVFSPFAGIGSEGYEAVKMGRKFVGVELKREYYDLARRYLAEAETLAARPTLFDLIDAGSN